ncbi:hypothetical protein BDC45DRAFT_553898 [Circinella umbellata]|nr:hypothetical protein BDC45DRAFT_553898 [Circinella umbellata]
MEKFNALNKMSDATLNKQNKQNYDNIVARVTITLEVQKRQKKKKIDRLDAMIELLILSKGKTKIIQRIIKSVVNLMGAEDVCYFFEKLKDEIGLSNSNTSANSLGKESARLSISSRLKKESNSLFDGLENQNPPSATTSYQAKADYLLLRNYSIALLNKQYLEQIVVMYEQSILIIMIIFDNNTKKRICFKKLEDRWSPELVLVDNLYIRSKDSIDYNVEEEILIEEKR